MVSNSDLKVIFYPTRDWIGKKSLSSYCPLAGKKTTCPRHYPRLRPLPLAAGVDPLLSPNHSLHHFKKIIMKIMLWSEVLWLRIRVQHFKWIRIRIQVLMNKKWKKNFRWNLFLFFFWSNIAINLSLGLHKGRPSYNPNLPWGPRTDMSRLGIEPGPPRWEASTLEKSHSNSLLRTIRNLYIWAGDYLLFVSSSPSSSSSSSGLSSSSNSGSSGAETTAGGSSTSTTMLSSPLGKWRNYRNMTRWNFGKAGI